MNRDPVPLSFCCDALSRCEHPKDCECPFQDMEEPLKCGPCKKCVKRAQDLQHPDFRDRKDLQHITTCSSANRNLVLSAIDIRAVSDPKSGSSTSDDNEKHHEKGHQVFPSWAFGRPLAEVKKLQEADPDISPILGAKSAADIKPGSTDMNNSSPATRQYWIQWNVMVLRDGILFKTFVKKNGCENHMQFIVPHTMKKEILTQFHDSVLSGHLGCKKTYGKILQRFYWFDMKSDVTLHIKQRDVCAANKIPNKKPRAPLGSVKAGAPWDVVATDYIGPLPVTNRGNRYILVLTDIFSKYVEVPAVPDQTAETCATRILNDFIARRGCPLSILSDQGRNYESNIFKELCRMLEIKKMRTSPRNPKCNGQTERFNRTLVRMIKAYLCQEQDEWDLHLGCLAGAYRATPNESTGLTPNLLTMGREVRLPSELVFGSKTLYNNEDVASYGEYVNGLRTRMQHAHRVARTHLNNAAKTNKAIYDTRVAHNSYKAGDVVWLLSETVRLG